MPSNRHQPKLPPPIVTLSRSEGSVWITHIVTWARPAHRTLALMYGAATRDRKTDGGGVRCPDTLWVTMWVIHTGLSRRASRCFAEFTLSEANVLSMTVLSSCRAIALPT